MRAAELEAWDVRDRDAMDALRADLMACPAEIRGDILADFMSDPVVAFGFRLRGRISAATGGLLFERSMLPQWWRGIVENVVPVDGRHPNADLLERFLAAAGRAGWCDPRLDGGPSFPQI